MDSRWRTIHVFILNESAISLILLLSSMCNSYWIMFGEKKKKVLFQVYLYKVTSCYSSFLSVFFQSERQGATQQKTKNSCSELRALTLNTENLGLAPGALIDFPQHPYPASTPRTRSSSPTYHEQGRMNTNGGQGLC